MSIELKVPEVGESVTEVQLGNWLKQEGEAVKQDEPLLEIETDKASMELPAPEDGVLTQILKQTGEEAAVGEVIAYLEAGAEAAESAPAKDQSGKESEAQATASEGDSSETDASQADTTPSQPTAEQAGHDETERKASPVARNMAREHDIDLSTVQGSGPHGRVLKEDVQDAIDRAKAKPAQPAAPTKTQPRPASTPSESPTPSRPEPAPVAAGAAEAERQEEPVAMTPMRRRIAERLVQAQQATASLTTFNEIDMSAISALRKRYQDQFVERYDIKLGFMSFFVKAVIEALKQIPQLNASIRDNEIVYRNYYDVGVAVSTERGLLVPVIRNAERLSFADIEAKIADMAKRARDKKIGLEELEGGTFTITNGGIFGSLLSTPILNPPQSGILGMHTIQKRPVVGDNDQIVVKPMMYVALTYDHRIVDGREAVTFLVKIKQLIEDPTRMLVEV